MQLYQYGLFVIKMATPAAKLPRVTYGNGPVFHHQITLKIMGGNNNNSIISKSTILIENTFQS